jgi:hypothetical protein
MRPLLWGTIWFAIGLVGWIAFSVIAGIGGAITGTPDPLMMGFVYLFGILFFFSLPIAIIAEIILWIRRRQQKV